MDQLALTMACLLLDRAVVRAIRQLGPAVVARSNVARQLVACALIGVAGCAEGTMDGADARPRGVDAAITYEDAARPAPDSTPVADAAIEVDAAPPPDGGAAAYRHTIAIDGVNDFAAGDELFGTTSAGYTAYVAWDDDALYVGYDGADVASSDANRWLLVFLDVDPGAATGALVGEQYNTQRPAMPAGFGAEYAFRWRASNDFQQVQSFAADVWSEAGVTPATYQAGTFVETAIPRAALGDPATLGITSLMVNETALSEGAYAGLYADNFADGYYDATVAAVPLTAYLEVDFASPATPNDPSHKKP